MYIVLVYPTFFAFLPTELLRAVHPQQPWSADQGV